MERVCCDIVAPSMQHPERSKYDAKYEPHREAAVRVPPAAVLPHGLHGTLRAEILERTVLARVLRVVERGKQRSLAHVVPSDAFTLRENRLPVRVSSVYMSASDVQ